MLSMNFRNVNFVIWISPIKKFFTRWGYQVLDLDFFLHADWFSVRNWFVFLDCVYSPFGVLSMFAHCTGNLNLVRKAATKMKAIRHILRRHQTKKKFDYPLLLIIYLWLSWWADVEIEECMRFDCAFPEVFRSVSAPERKCLDVWRSTIFMSQFQNKLLLLLRVNETLLMSH